MTGTPGFPGTFWYLEGFADDDRRLRRIPILTLPFEIGRRPGLGLSLSSTLVSQQHARIEADRDRLRIRDLESTNGTFLNQRRLTGEAPLEVGDILHFGEHEFRIDRFEATTTGEVLERTVAVSNALAPPRVEASHRLRTLLAERAVRALFQPIVELEGGARLGFEILGRGVLEGLPSRAPELFDLARVLGAEAELSRIFRDAALADCLELPGSPLFFFNTHPAESGTTALEESLRSLRRTAPELPSVIEIHERSVTDPGAVGRLRHLLDELDMQLAYDDFGSGQARLQELAAVPPDYLKFDLALIRELHIAPGSRRKVVRSLLAMARDLEIDCVAEGVESEEEAESCRDLGFRFAQGYLYGPPVPADLLAGTPVDPGEK